jgi:hypothetical protein
MSITQYLFARLGIYYDFDSQIKSLWLTRYILIMWEWDYNFRDTFEVCLHQWNTDITFPGINIHSKTHTGNPVQSKWRL